MLGLLAFGALPGPMGLVMSLIYASPGLVLAVLPYRFQLGVRDLAPIRASHAAPSPGGVPACYAWHMNDEYARIEPLRDDVDRLEGATLLEFGSPDCGHCRRAQPLLAAALDAHPGLRHLKIFDGRGQPLGRSFRVKLWPTLVFFRHGEEVSRLVRPLEVADIAAALRAIDGGDGEP